jgi:hypothetical protein
MRCARGPWGAEPQLRRLEVEFSGQVAFTYVMGGMSREIDAPKKWRAASEFAVRPLEFAFGERWEPA